MDEEAEMLSQPAAASPKLPRPRYAGAISPCGCLVHPSDARKVFSTNVIWVVRKAHLRRLRSPSCTMSCRTEGPSVMSKAIVKITYCSGCGYKKNQQNLAAELAEEFGDDIEVTWSQDWATTGNFEVVLVNTGELLHSKKTRGQGLCEKFEEVQAIIQQVRAYLDSQGESA